MYPFERFTKRAKRALTLAQEEASRHHHSYIGTEHLLLGLVRVRDGVAAKALADLDIGLEAVRRTIESVLGGSERPRAQQIVPTSRVKKVIELSFEEARAMGLGHVGTEHLLLGLVVEGDGVAAHALRDLGAGPKEVRAAVERALHDVPLAAPPGGTQPGYRGLTELLNASLELAAAEGSEVGPEHLLLALAAPGTPVGDALATGTDLTEAGGRLTALAQAVRDRRAEREQAAGRPGQEPGELREAEREAVARFREAMTAWRRDLGLASQ